MRIGGDRSAKSSCHQGVITLVVYFKANPSRIDGDMGKSLVYQVLTLIQSIYLAIFTVPPANQNKAFLLRTCLNHP
jgi:hypothetical protein